MNFLCSYDWLKEHVALTDSVDHFAARFSLSGPSVEHLLPQGDALERVVIGHVVKIESHPDADKLRLATVDIGQLQKKPLSIVCGGSNLKESQWVAVAMVGANVRWHGQGERVTLTPTEIRGVKSDGMICAANEIGLFDAFPHNDREILDLERAIPEGKWQAGMRLADALGIGNDVVMDVEVTTNRVDTMSVTGLAREASAIFKKPFLWKPAPAIKGTKTDLSVKVLAKKLCPRYMAVRIDGIAVGPSPWWIKRRLLSAGVRPVNNVVDITNFVMLELGQPMHAFDAAKLAAGRIVVRTAKKGETLAALDGKTYALDENTLVIADAEKPVAIAGIMGAEASGVTAETQAVIFEAATFDARSVRKTSRMLNLFSDAQLRFEKGLSSESPPDALARAVELCLEIAGGTAASAVADVSASKNRPRTVSISLEEAVSLIGVEVKKKDMVDTLKRLGFTARTTASTLFARVPGWRDLDIESGRDLVEEIARVIGYANIPPIFPAGLSAQRSDPELAWETRLKTAAKGAGLTETYSYSYASKELMRKAGYRAEKMFRIQNPMVADEAYLRTSLLPSLIQIVAENQERFRRQRLFEVAKVYYPSQNGALPDETLEMGAAFYGGDRAWKEAKGFAETVYAGLGLEEIEWRPLADDPFWHPGRSAQAFQDKHLLGTIGEIHPFIAARFALEGRLAMIDLPLREVFAHAKATKRFMPPPLFPEAKRDLALWCPRETPADDLIKKMKETGTLLSEAQWFDTYRGEGENADRKSVAFHLAFSHPERTLEANEVDGQMEAIEAALKEVFGAEVRRG